MKTQVYFGIAIRIIILFTIGSLMTFVPDHLRAFFGDTVHVCDTGWHSHGFFGIDKSYEWGARHYWYFWMMVLLFLLSLVNVIVGIIKLVNKHYPEL